jgi:hypothetical protein
MDIRSRHREKPKTLIGFGQLFVAAGGHGALPNQEFLFTGAA